MRCIQSYYSNRKIELEDLVRFPPSSCLIVSILLLIPDRYHVEGRNEEGETIAVVSHDFTSEERQKLQNDSKETKEIRGFDSLRWIYKEKSYDEILEITKDCRRNRKSCIFYEPKDDEWDDEEEEDWCKLNISDM